MPYFIIHKYPVFLTDNRITEIKKELLKEKTASFRVLSSISKTKENLETKKRMHKYLQSLYMQDKEKFINEFVEFSFTGNEAKENLFFLLNDYCNYFKNSNLVDVRDIQEKILQSITGDDFEYPIGKVFLLNHGSVYIVVAVNDVQKISGSLLDFTIKLNERKIRLSKKIYVSNSSALD